jgi:hypothetical protein
MYLFFFFLSGKKVKRIEKEHKMGMGKRIRDSCYTPGTPGTPGTQE